MDLKAMIFDLDGVLTDTAEYHYQSWQRLSDEYGLPFSREVNEQLRGVSRRQSLEIILQDRVVPEEQIQAMMNQKNSYYMDMLKRVTPADLLPGAPQLLSELREAGIKIAIGSASKNACEVVARLEIEGEIDAIADGYSVVRPKPAPDLFVFAAGMLRTPVEYCVVVEDAEAGVEAAREAGMCVIGLGPSERVGRADLVLPDLTDVTLADILARLPARRDR